PFFAVGAHYRDFTQTEDDEVIRLLDEAHQWTAEAAEPSVT
ncbi:MAG: phosphoribosyltransferase, partial [Alphaproteobacteria bacterium]|nr:phosphoribosyltransferase [Alphaproteobacteria bacterium]